MDTLQLNIPALVPDLRAGVLNLFDYIDALEAWFEQREPEVLAFVPENGRFQRLRHDAQILLDTYPDPVNRPPIFGLPIGVKDIFHVDGFITQAGSQLPGDILQGPQADSVTSLRAAGALIMGKTVTTEFAYFAPGATRNPYNLAHTPGGSSSGSAAAVGAGLCPFAFGTQTIGSINRPAAFCGTVGYKPSYDRISRAGVIPLSESLDHIGFFTNDVAGAALAASLLCKNWQTGIQLKRRPILGIPTGPYLGCADAEGLAHFQNSCDLLRAAGFTIKSVAALPDFEQIRQQHLALMAYETAAFHAHWFAAYRDLYHEKTVELIERGQAVTAVQVQAAKAAQHQLRAALQNLMIENELDAWITPSAKGPAPLGLSSTGDPIMNLPWTNSGLPTLTIPSSLSAQGLPLGLQLVGHWSGDEVLFAVGMQVEAEDGIHV
ncbi:MAG: amidase [Anaerolineales bacterium]|nr:amidase [Anaerolineales bacterium]